MIVDVSVRMGDKCIGLGCVIGDHGVVQAALSKGMCSNFLVEIVELLYVRVFRLLPNWVLE